jgi:hypothetical protein
MATENEKRKLVKDTSRYFVDQLKDIEKITARTGLNKSNILREGADMAIEKYNKKK